MRTVSVIIPSYNAAGYLPDAIGSCLDQTFKDIEIIVVDDGSTDNTREVVVSFPVHYHYQPNKGVSAARNAGWALATGEYLQFLDADDVLLPTKIEKSLAAFTPDVDLVYTGHEYRSVDLRQPMPTPYTETPEGDVFPRFLALKGTLFPVHAPLIRRSAADRTRKFREHLQNAEDLLFWIELSSLGASFKRVDEVLVWYRITPGSLSKDAVRMARGRLAAAEAMAELPLPAGYDLNHHLADRHYMLAMRLWEAGLRVETRSQLRQALARLPKTPRRRLVYAFLIGMSYVFSQQRAELWLSRALKVTARP